MTGALLRLLVWALSAFVCPLHMATLGFLMVDLVVSLLNSNDRAEDARSFKGSAQNRTESLLPPLRHIRTRPGWKAPGADKFPFLGEWSRMHVRGEKEMMVATFGDDTRQLPVCR